MRGNLIETLKIMEFLIMVDIFLFNISLQSGNLQSKPISKTKSMNKSDFFVNRLIYFENKLPNQIKNRVKKFKIKLNDFRKKMVRKII